MSTWRSVEMLLEREQAAETERQYAIRTRGEQELHICEDCRYLGTSAKALRMHRTVVHGMSR